MEFCDVSVRVLYDFEYTTKYGRNIKITGGERLLLIKKTNNDWWQVIRNSEQRPFFVPASYVEEIKTSHFTSNKDQSKSKCTKQTQNKTQPEKNAQSSSIFLSKEQSKTNPDSVKKLNLYDKSSLLCTSEKHDEDSNLKKEINLSKLKILSNTMSSSGYNSLCEEIPVFDEDEASYSPTVDDSDSNTQGKSDGSFDSESKSHSISKSNFDSKPCDATVDPPAASDKELSGNRDNIGNTLGCEMVENKLHKCNLAGKYSAVINPRANISEVSDLRIISTLPNSDSLENLSLQIELKTSSLRSTTDTNQHSGVLMNKTNICNTTDDLENKNKCFSNDNSSVSQKGNEKDSKLKFHAILLQHRSKESISSENVCENPQSSVENSNLHYHGSFKTDTERQRWIKKGSTEKRLRNVFSCSDESRIDSRSSSVSGLEEVNDVPVCASSGSANVCSNEGRCVVDTREIITRIKTDEGLQKSEARENVLPIRQLSFGSDSQLYHLKAAREKTTSNHSLDSVIEGEFKASSSEEFEHKKYISKEFPSMSKNVFESQQANSEKSSTDSLLDIGIDQNYRKISGGTTSDSLVPTDGEDLASSDSETHSVKFTNNKHEDFKSANNTRKIPLTRRRRVYSSKARHELSQEPPSPTPNQEPIRTLTEGWNEYDTQDGRKYFYNPQSKERRWKPPRRNHVTNVEIQDERDSNCTTDTDDMFVVSLPLPSGWRSELDSASEQTCYINIASGAKWFSSTDSEGRVYFFEENSNTSSWTLPDSPNVNNNESKVPEVLERTSVSLAVEKSFNRNVKSKSMILANRNEETISLSNSSHNWPQLWEGNMCILKEGPLNKTKITDNGKRVRKNWTSTHAVLTELLLLFFKDNKGFPSMMSGNGRPELSVDLNGAVIDPGDKISSRKNVYMVSTVLGLQVLIQCDCTSVAEQWLRAIQAAINSLPSSIDTKSPRAKSESPSDESKLNTRIGRSKSMKLKNKSASIEDMSVVNMAERQTKIKERLKKFFHRRPTVELLVKKGIWKDEPVFGCLLEQACSVESPRVPLFVQHCIHCIESSEDNMKTDGLYRASGNLSQVQKIRLQVDQNVYSLLEQEEDVHVLAGTLKLFFRELKQPLIPFKFFKKALNASTNSNRTEKMRDFREIVKALPTCNHDTLKFLLKHLISVTQYQEYNRMHIPNIAIVFGPTLMWPEQESLNMAFDLMQQNLVIECLLSDFHLIFQ